MKNWLIGFAAVVALGAILFLSDRKVENPSGIELIRSDAELSDTMNKALQLSGQIIQRDIAGEAVTEDDKGKLREAVKLFEALRLRYNTWVTNACYAGMCHKLLGEKQRAAECFEQAVLNKRFDPLAKRDLKNPDRIAMELTAYEAAAQLSEVTLDLAAEEIANYNSLSQANDMTGAEAAKKRSEIYYDKAMEFSTLAVENVPTSAKYLVDRANVYLALKKVDLAKLDIKKAKTINPNDARVKMAAKMVGL